MKQIYFIYILILSCSFGCYTTKTTVVSKPLYSKTQKLTETEVQSWYHKDILQDSIPGISLDKAYKELLTQKKGDTVLIAVLDTEIDGLHEELSPFLWKNIHEIPDNSIDDDQNGYIDDVFGWNFLGNASGEDVIYTNYESTKIVRAYDSLFKGKAISEIDKKDIEKYTMYTKALAKYASRLEHAKSYYNAYKGAPERYAAAVAEAKKYFANNGYTIAQVDSVAAKQESFKPHAEMLRYCLHYGFTYDILAEGRKLYKIELEKYLGYNGYTEDSIIGDKADDITDIYYGNPNIYAKADGNIHSTEVTGLIAADRSNAKGIKGVTNLVKILPVRITSKGSERNKDVFTAIKYAVDQGAQIINMSFRDGFSLQRDWEDDALKYAAQHDVLLVAAAGNESSNIDVNHDSFPNDQVENGVEFVDNFLVAGATWYEVNENLVAPFSSYGKHNVDIFAPAQQIYTTTINNAYLYDSGTSLAAPLVTGIAALLKAYYPNLSASELKSIIMESGVSYDIMVNRPSKDKEQKEEVPFSSLSKSGKIANAYNALLLAEEVSKKKKRNKR